MLSQLCRWFLSGVSYLVTGLQCPRISSLCSPSQVSAKSFGNQCGKLAENQFASSCQPGSWLGCTAEGAAQGLEGLAAGRRRAWVLLKLVLTGLPSVSCGKYVRLQWKQFRCSTLARCSQNTPNGKLQWHKRGMSELCHRARTLWSTDTRMSKHAVDHCLTWDFFLWRCEFTFLHANIFILNILLTVDICMLKCIFIIHYLVLQILLLFVPQTWESVPLQ